MLKSLAAFAAVAVLVMFFEKAAAANESLTATPKKVTTEKVTLTPAEKAAAANKSTTFTAAPSQRPSLESLFPDLTPAEKAKRDNQASWQSNFLGLGMPVGQVIGGLALLAGYGVGLLIIKMVPFLFVIVVVALAVLFVRRRWNTV
jgi:hypothetical protein